MSFTDEDLKRLKDELDKKSPDPLDFRMDYWTTKLFIARLDAAEKCIIKARYENGELIDEYKAWLVSKGYGDE